VKYDKIQKKIITGREKRTASVYENLMICDGCRKDILTYITYYFEGHSNG
jgi:hypothetical protein